MRILVINQPLNNHGDESAHKAFMSRLASLAGVNITMLFIGGNPDSIEAFKVRKDNVSYIRLKPQAGFVAAFKAGINYNMRFLWYLHPLCRRIITYYNNSDLVICAPGGICLGGFQNWQHLSLLEVARTLNKPLAYYGRSFGPFPTATKDNVRFKKAAIRLLNYMGFISIRDKKTELLADNLNLNYESTVDSAFLGSPDKSLPLEFRQIIGTDKYVVFVPNSLTWHFAFKGKVTDGCVLEFFSRILSVLERAFPNCKIVLLPQIFNSGDAGGDECFFNAIKSYRNNDDKIVVLSEKINSDYQQSIISKAELMVGARYHSIVFALNNATPFVALSYEHKILGLLETLNKTENLIDITHIMDDDESYSSFFPLFEEKIRIAKSDPDARRIAKQIAGDCFDKFEVFLRGYESKVI